MTKRETTRAMKQLERNGWRPNGLTKWDTGGWSVSVIGTDGWPIRLDSLDAVDERMTSQTFDEAE